MHGGKGEMVAPQGDNSDRSVILVRRCGYAWDEPSQNFDVKRTTFVFAMVVMHN